MQNQLHALFVLALCCILKLFICSFLFLGRHTGKFQPKPNKKTRKDKPSTYISLLEVEFIMHLQAPQLVSSEIGYMDEGSITSFAADYPFQDSSMRFDDFLASDLTSEIPINEELRNLIEDSHFLGDLHRKDVPDIPVEVVIQFLTICYALLIDR